MAGNHRNHYLYRGRSMWPTFQEGDLLEVIATEPQQLRAGDCIVYLSAEHQQIIHRVVACRGEILTRGDAMPAIDTEPVPPDRIVGKVVRRSRFGRSVAVRGGYAGLVMGLLYRYAGRLDPDRNALGGRLACRIRDLSMKLFGAMWLKSGARSLVSASEAPVQVWKIGNFVVAGKKAIDGPWLVTWPWKVFLKLPSG